jgi:thiol-disulfide isomerase/thioredoxin
MILRSAALLAATVTLGGCASTAVLRRLEAVEARLTALENRPAGAAAPVEDPIAAAKFREATDQYANGDVEAARRTAQEIMAQHAGTRAAASAESLLEEMRVVGQPGGDLSAVTSWVQGGPTDLTSGVDLLVFWETWCPHCRREVPALGATLAGRDVDAVLLTRLSRDTTAAQAEDFLKENAVALPCGVENGDIASRYGVRGIPAAAIVKDGVVVWRGHPARMTAILDRLAPPQ